MLVDKTKKAIQEHKTIPLTARDTEAFVNALLKHPAPSERLKRAAQRFKKIMGS